MGNRAPGYLVSRPMHGTFRALSVLAPALALLLLAGCVQHGASPGTGGTPTPEPITLTAAELRLLLIDRLGPRWYCDPDEYPIAHGTEQENAIEAYPEMRQETVVFTAVAKRLGIDPGANHTDAQKLAIYHLWKVAVSIPLDPVGNGRYRFDYLAQPVAGAQQGLHTAGMIDDHGAITVEQQALEGEPNCPICLARGTLIDTPDGPVPVERLRLGDPVWTIDAVGRRIAGKVIALGSTPAPADHHVVRLRLADGRSVTASPGHPLADGRLLGDVRVGDVVDGSRVVAAYLVAYDGEETFDLVASGPTGLYFAGGIALGTTLR